MKWKTKDSRVMEISEMTDSHLINTFNMVYRKAIERKHEPIFDGLFAWATVLNEELSKRNIHSHDDQYSELEDEFMAYDDSDWQEPMWRNSDMEFYLGKD